MASNDESADSILPPSSRAGTIIETTGHSAPGVRRPASRFSRQHETISHKGISKSAQNAKSNQPNAAGTQTGMMKPSIHTFFDCTMRNHGERSQAAHRHAFGLNRN